MRTEWRRRLAAGAKNAAVGVLLTGLAGLVAGCSVSQPFPDRATYALDPGHPDKANGAAAGLTLRVMAMRIAKPYDSQLFNYKIGPSKFTQDYYAGFIAAPDHLLGSQLIEWMNDSGAVRYAAAVGTTLDCSANLDCQVTALYADRTAQQAVLEMRVFVISDDPGATRILLQKTYRETEPLAGATPDALVTAWNAAFRRLLQELAGDLGGIKAAAADAARVELGELPAARKVAAGWPARENGGFSLALIRSSG